MRSKGSKYYTTEPIKTKVTLTKYYNKTPIKVETIEQYKEYVNAVKYWQSIKNMTEREKNEICKGYADLIINKTSIS